MILIVIDFVSSRVARECSVCYLSRREGDYLAQLSKNCQHAHRTVCYDCVYQNILMTLGSLMSNPIICPEWTCQARFSAEEVRHLLEYYDNRALLDKYDTYLATALLENMPEFVWCAHGCGSGQLHPSEDPQVNCIVCDRATCFFHHVPWHEGLTCEEYDAFGAMQDAVSLKYLKNFTKQCPTCNVNIEKNSGCDHMTCTRCRTEFCWHCLVPFGQALTLYSCPHKTDCIYYQTAPVYREFHYRIPTTPFRHRIRHRWRSSMCTII